MPRWWEASFLSRETLRPRGLNGMLEPEIARIPPLSSNNSHSCR